MVRSFGLVLSGMLGFSVYMGVAQRPWSRAMILKATGNDPGCTWEKLLKTPWHQQHLGEIKEKYASGFKLIETDEKAGIQRFQSPSRPFWVNKSGLVLAPQSLLAYVFAEQEWIDWLEPAQGVKRGDVVVDIGAHVGTFGDHALRRGAAKVIMVEPDPINQECIRRNFPAEIASGKVVLIPFGAWSEEKTLEFHTGVGNSGTGSFVIAEDESKVTRLDVKTIDQMLAPYGKIDFLKMDIEGAEREALKGAANTLRQYKPRIMLDAYHLDDDGRVLPPIILAANSGYRQICATCSPSRHAQSSEFVPYLIYFE